MPFAKDLILLGSLRQSFRHIEISNPSIISYLIARARMGYKFWSSYSYLISQTEYIIDKYLRSKWDKRMKKKKFSKVSNESGAEVEEQECSSTDLII